jgi:hypothetical protein
MYERLIVSAGWGQIQMADFCEHESWDFTKARNLLSNYQLFEKGSPTCFKNRGPSKFVHVMLAVGWNSSRQFNFILLSDLPGTW